MLFILANWIFIFVISLGMGYLFSHISGKFFDYKLKSFTDLLFAGLVVATTYAQFFSLFGKVNLAAFCIIIFASFVCLWIFRKDFIIDAKNWFRNNHLIYILSVLLLVIIWSFFTSHGYSHYDTALYHAQSIRWIEEYGVVKGLGNLHSRLAYNSSLFTTTALFSMKYMFGQSMHTVNGWFGLLLSFTILQGIPSIIRSRRLLLSDYACVGAFYYLTLIADEVVSPASDYAVMCTVFFIIIKWLRALEDKEGSNQIAPYALLCIAIVYSVTLKLTACLMIILLIKPLIMLIRSKKAKQTLLYFLTGFIVVLPWLARTVILSGWLIYPFASLDLFNFDWKIPADLVRMDSDSITRWARAVYSSELVNAPTFEWLKNWFVTTLSRTEMLLVAGDVFVLFALIINSIWALLRKHREKADVLLVFYSLSASYLLWQFGAPDPRFGYSYILLLDLLAVGMFFFFLKKDFSIRILITLFVAVKVLTVGKYTIDDMPSQCFIRQQDYENFDTIAYTIFGETFYAPSDGGDRTGYSAFPSTPGINENVTLRGNGLTSGFCYSNEK